MTRVFVLAVILGLSFYLRLWNLASLPLGFHGDEAFAGYNAYSLIKTGKDVNGQSWPRYFNLFGDYRPAGIVYSIIPSLQVFGLNEFAVRLPVALVGAVTPLFLYFFVKQLTGKEPVSIASAFFLTILPWHIVLSRATAEQILGVFMVLLVGIFAVMAFRKGKIYWWLATYLALLFSFWTYHSVNLFMPFFVAVLTIYFYKTSPKKKHLFIWLAVVGIYLIFPYAHQVFFGQALSRAGQVVEINNPASDGQLAIWLSQEPVGQAPIFLVRLFYNKVAVTVLDLFQRYSDYFSLKFLFFGGSMPQRYQVPGVGLLLFPTVFGLIGSFVFLLVNWSKKKLSSAQSIFLAWLFFAPVAAALSLDDHPNMSRDSIIAPAISFLAADGIVAIYELKKYLTVKILLVITVILGFWHLAFFWRQYSVHEKYFEGLTRNLASREAAKKLAAVPKNYQILATNWFLGTDVFTLFYEPVNPKVSQAAWAVKTTDKMQLENYTFLYSQPCATKADLGKIRQYQVYLDNGYCDVPDWAEAVNIYFPDGSVAAKIQFEKGLLNLE